MNNIEALRYILSRGNTALVKTPAKFSKKCLKFIKDMTKHGLEKNTSVNVSTYLSGIVSFHGSIDSRIAVYTKGYYVGSIVMNPDKGLQVYATHNYFDKLESILNECFRKPTNEWKLYHFDN